MKVFGIGYNKTGTTTLGVCLKHFGFKHRSHDLSLVQAWNDGAIERVIEAARAIDSAEDWPWPLVYKELDEAFEDCKFVLTTRVNSEVWYRSLSRHAQRTGPTQMRQIIFGHDMPDGFEQLHRDMYDAHNEAVRAYFANRPDDFLEVCWEKGHGWEELCAFLDRPVPPVPFPHANQHPGGPLRRIRKATARKIKKLRDGDEATNA